MSSVDQFLAVAGELLARLGESQGRWWDNGIAPLTWRLEECRSRLPNPELARADRPAAVVYEILHPADLEAVPPVLRPLVGEPAGRFVAWTVLLTSDPAVLALAITLVEGVTHDGRRIGDAQARWHFATSLARWRRAVAKLPRKGRASPPAASKPRRRKDWVRWAKALVEKYPNIKDSEIARELNISPSTVSRSKEFQNFRLEKEKERARRTRRAVIDRDEDGGLVIDGIDDHQPADDLADI